MNNGVESTSCDKKESCDKKDARNRRRNYLINPVFQLRYTLSLATGAFLVACFLGISMYGFLFQQARAKALSPLSGTVWDNTAVIFFFALAFAVMLLVVLGAWGVTITHRISGPVYVLANNLKTLASGRFPRRRDLRKRDEFKELHNQFFQCVDSLKARKEQDVDQLAKVLDRLSNVTHMEENAREAVLSGVAADIRAMHDELASALGREVKTPMAEAVSTPPANSASPQPPAEPVACSK